MLKSTLSNVPTYFLSFFPIPARVAKRMEKVQRDFLWGSLGDEHNFHLVSWKTMCDPFWEGGLRVQSISHISSALLGKWLKRFGMEDGTLRRFVVASKY